MDYYTAFGCFLFFGKKEIIRYTVYVIFLIIFICYLAHSSIFEIRYYRRQLSTEITDIFVIVFNMLTITLVVYYKDKIRILRSQVNIVKHKEISVPDEVYQKTVEKYEELFLKIDETVNANLYFKNPNFNLTDLCSNMKINNGYLSKAIRYKGFTNFNHYLNYHRIEFAKQLIKESDIKKVTIMYIYSEAGFRSQSTFNRAFKFIEGMTPSEYMASNLLESSNIH